MQPIYTQTVGAGGASVVTFNNIPQTFTDLKLVVSAKFDIVGVDNNAAMIRFNGATTGYSYLGFANNSSGGASSFNAANTTQGYIGENNTSSGNNTANTFSSLDTYIPNYASSSFKQVISDGAWENNSTTVFVLIALATLWRNTSPITSISIYGFSGGNFVANTTVSLYGITKG